MDPSAILSRIVLIGYLTWLLDIVANFFGYNLEWTKKITILVCFATIGFFSFFFQSEKDCDMVGTPTKSTNNIHAPTM